MKSISRTKCEITKNEDLESLFGFKNFPVFMGCTNQDIEKDLLFDMDWCISVNSGLIQLKNLLPLDILYPEAHGAGIVGDLWMKHHQAFSKFVNSYTPSGVIEIGGAHGILSKEYQKFDDIPWTIVEPNPTPIEGVKAKFIKGFFDNTFTFSDEYSAIIHSHVFEHIYEPDVFMEHISKFMESGKYLIFSVPNLEIMLKRKYTNCINFEHTVFITEEYIEYLMAKYGFRVDKKEHFMDDHSIFYGLIKDNSVKPKELNDKLYEKNKKLYLDYISYHHSLVDELNAKIEKTKNPIYLFGAHVFAQYLIAFGLNTEKIICLLDNDPDKHNKRLYGTSLKVASPKILEEIKNPMVILKAGVYNDEIKKDILENINSNSIFWE